MAFFGVHNQKICLGIYINFLSHLDQLSSVNHQPFNYIIKFPFITVNLFYNINCLKIIPETNHNDSIALLSHLSQNLMTVSRFWAIEVQTWCQFHSSEPSQPKLDGSSTLLGHRSQHLTTILHFWTIEANTWRQYDTLGP